MADYQTCRFKFVSTCNIAVVLSWGAAVPRLQRPAVRQVLAYNRSGSSRPVTVAGFRAMETRDDGDEAYVVGLRNWILGEDASTQHKFDWLLGDPGMGGRCVKLPVDAY
jgi:hypothetical protein